MGALEDGRTRRWLAEARGGDEASFTRLYEHVAPALYAWAELRLRRDVRAHVEPADLVQEVWFRAWRAFPGFDEESVPFRPWLFRVAKNVLLEATRAMGRGGKALGPTTRLFALQNLPDDATAVSRRMARDEGLAAFSEQVRALPEDDRKLVVLCGLEGLPHKEVAARMELGVEAVTKRWQRLRAKLEAARLPEHLLALEGAL